MAMIPVEDVGHRGQLNWIVTCGDLAKVKATERKIESIGLRNGDMGVEDELLQDVVWHMELKRETACDGFTVYLYYRHLYAHDFCAKLSLNVKNSYGVTLKSTQREREVVTCTALRASETAISIFVSITAKHVVESGGHLVVVADIQVLSELPKGIPLDDERARQPSTSSAIIIPPPVVFSSLDIMGQRLYSMRGDTGDFVLVCQEANQEIAAHRNILQVWSSVFRAMFATDTLERRTGRCTIEDIDAETLGAMLHFMYGQSMEDHWTKEEMAEKLLVAADRYEVLELKSLCEQQLLAKLNDDTAASMLIFADVHASTWLRRTVLEYIVEHRRSFVEGSGLAEVREYDVKIEKEVLKAMV